MWEGRIRKDVFRRVSLSCSVCLKALGDVLLGSEEAVKRNREKKRLGGRKAREGRGGGRGRGCREEAKPSGRQRKVPAQQPCSRWERGRRVQRGTSSGKWY